jgi:hypothetical protein
MQPATRLLINFIIKQELDLEQFPSLENSLREKFDITKDTKDGKEATKELVDLIIFWENHPGIYDSLETLINCNFWIKSR